MVSSTGIRFASFNDIDSSWVAYGLTHFTCLYFGEPQRPTSPVAVFLHAHRDVGDHIAGLRTHATTTMTTVISGSAQVDGRWMQNGDIQVVQAGVPHGDIVIGPQGAIIMMLFANRSGMIPAFADGDDQQTFDRELRQAVEPAADGRSQEPVALLPPRPTHTPRRGVKVLALEPVGAVAPPPEPVPAGVMYTHLTDDSLPWGPPVLNARTALIVLGDGADPAAPTVGVIDVKPGVGDRLRGRHQHRADAVNLVLRGGLYMDGVWLRPGQAKIVDADVEYGDGMVGPEGVNFLEIWSRQDGVEPAFIDGDDQRYFEQLVAKGHLAERRSA